MAASDDTTFVQLPLFSTAEPEEWRPVVGWEGLYEVSNLGRVRSLDREYIPKDRTTSSPLQGRMLITYKFHAYGYLGVGLSRDGKPRRRYVHTLVLEAFVGPRPPGMYCNHIDADPTNNRVSNLEWCTQKQNMQHASRLGRTKNPAGEDHARAKVTAEQVLTIRRMAQEGESQRELASLFGLSRRAVRLIINRETWKHLP